ncbi:Uncharacterised protein [Shigella sonnei]|nr:Uncharacterised protein [Shigella sonnei]
MAAANRAQNGFTREYGGGFHRGGDAHAHQYRWTGVYGEGGDIFEDEFHHAFVAF